jgi:hypothetical protein
MKNRVQYPAYGTWMVTTEGDCEGRSTTNLGVHEGFIDEIAFKLGAKSYYSLNFTLVNPKEYKNELSGRDTVNIVLNIDSGTWDLTPADRAAYISNILKDRPCVVTSGSYYASVTLSKKDTAATKKLKTQREKLLREIAELEKKINEGDN